jgi:hypothetical protein
VRKYLFLLTVLLGLAFTARASEAPVLHDIEIEGSAGNPQLSIQDLKLEVNREYLFVINNPLAVSLVFQFEKLGQHVATRYLQGSPSVTQESVNVLPNSKVIWHFVTTMPGEFTVYIINPSLMQKGETRKIAIVDPVVQAELEKVAVIEAAKKAKPNYRSRIKH